MTTRTDQQNKAIWLYCDQLAQALNESGWDMRKTLANKQNAKVLAYLKSAQKMLIPALNQCTGSWVNILSGVNGTLNKVIALMSQGPEVEIPWTKHSVMDGIWRTVQVAMIGNESTTKLEVEQVSEIYETVNRAIATTTGVSIPFPNQQEK